MLIYMVNMTFCVMRLMKLLLILIKFCHFPWQRCKGGGFLPICHKTQYSPALARDAHIYFYGALDEQFPELPIVDMFQTNAVFHAYSLFNYVENSEMCAKGKAFVYDALAKGKIKPNIDKVYPMEGYRDAWDYLKTPRKTHGKVVIETGVH